MVSCEFDFLKSISPAWAMQLTAFKKKCPKYNRFQTWDDRFSSFDIGDQHYNIVTGRTCIVGEFHLFKRTKCPTCSNFSYDIFENAKWEEIIKALKTWVRHCKKEHKEIIALHD